MKWEIDSRKGYSFNQLPQVALMIVFIGITIGVGAYLNHEIANTSYPTTAVQMETVTWVDNATYIKLAYPYIKSIEGVYNGTTATLANTYTSGNYSFTEEGGLLCCKVCGTKTCNVNTTLQVNYTTWNGAEYYVSKNATSGMRNLSVWIPIIAVVIAASVVIGLLMTSFMRRENL
jgi:hypothetical protein